MAKHKNFTINRVKNEKGISAKNISIGDVFEREGSLHMRVQIADGTPSGKITICNLNTGSVWCVSTDERFLEAHDCVIDYNVDTKS